MFIAKMQAPLRRVLSFGSLHGRDKFLLKAGSSGLIQRLLTTALTLIPTALLTRALGAEVFGIWIALSILPQWLSLTDSGIGSSLTIKLSAHFADGDWKAASTLVWSAFWTQATIATAVMVSVVIALQHFGISWMFKSPPANEDIITASAILLACTTIICLPLRQYAVVLSAYQRPIDNAFLGLIGPILIACASLAVYFRELNLFQYTVLFCTANILQCFVGSFWIFGVRFKELWKPMNFKWPVGWNLTKTGFIFFLGGITWIVNSTADSILLSRLVGPSATTDYNLCLRLFSFTSLATGLLGSGLIPAYAEAKAKQDWSWIRARFRHSLLVSVIIGIIAAGITSIAARWVIDLWAGGVSKPSLGLILNFAAWFMIFPINQVIAFLLSGLERPKDMLRIGIGIMALNIPLTYLLIHWFGVSGAVAGSAIALLIFGVAYPIRIINRILDEKEAPSSQPAT